MSVDGGSRYFPHDHFQPAPAFTAASFRELAEAELTASLERINANNPPVQTCSTGWTFDGLYTGPTSIAFLFLRLAALNPAGSFKGQTYQDWANAYLFLGGQYMPSYRRHSHSRHGLSVEPANCGTSSETLAQLTLKALVHHDESLAAELCAYFKLLTALRPGNEGSNEWLYGRAGYLYFLRLTRAGFADHAAVVAKLNQTMQAVIDRILAAPQPWVWHDKAYVGAVHGALGTIAQIVLCLSPGAAVPAPGTGPATGPATATATAATSASASSSAAPASPSTLPTLPTLSPEQTDVMTRVLHDVLGTQYASGNFPSSLPASHRDELVQFCHGSPGAALCLSTIRPWVESLGGSSSSSSSSLAAQLDRALRLAQEDTWARGLLRKDPSLCHGIAGNALALGADDRFRVFCGCMASRYLEDGGGAGGAGDDRGGRHWSSDLGVSDRAVGLYTGEAGRAWVWAVALWWRGPDGSGASTRPCIGFNDV